MLEVVGIYKSRLVKHNLGYEKYTRKGIPWQFVCSTEKSTRSAAYRLELKLKNLNRNRLILFMLKFSDGLQADGGDILRNLGSSQDDA